MYAFISWTGRDRDVKNVLVEKLREEGISCWDSEEYCTSDFSQECINAIKRCGVFIVIVSDASMQTGYVKNEIIAARKQEEAGLLNMLVYKITDAPYTDDFEFQLNHISFVTGNLVQRQENLRGDSAIDTLVKRVKRLLLLRKNGEPEKPFSVKLPLVEGRQLTGDTGYFVANSRDDILEAIEIGFTQSNTIVLTEFVGFGKRSVIRKYLSLHPGLFSTAVMASNQSGSLRNFLLSDLRFSNLNPTLFDALEGDALIDAKLRQLEKLGSDTLLVIPELELPEDRELYRRLLGLQCRIILLTQGSAESCYDLLPVIRVGRMDDAYLNELFFHHYTRAYEEEKELLTLPLTDFFNQIGGHTKTVELTASVLNRDMGVMPDQVSSFLSLQGVEGMELKDRILSQLSNIFAIEQLTDSQAKALVIAACLAAPYLSEQHFRQLLAECGHDNWQEIMDLDSHRWLDLDLKNRTVSIEPLVAQIVLQHFPQEQETLLMCLHYLESAFPRQIGAMDSSGFLTSNLARITHFFRLTGLDILADLTEELKQHSISPNTDHGALSAALARFQEAYPEDTFSADPAYMEYSSLEAMLIYSAQHFVRTNLLPIAKLLASDLAGIWSDYSGGSNRVLEAFTDGNANLFSFSSMIGMEQEEFSQWLQTMRQGSIDESDDAQDAPTRFMGEALSVIEALTRRDTGTLLLGMENLLLHAKESPELLYDSELADMFFSCAVGLANIYFVSEAYPAAIRLCQKVLSHSCSSPHRILLLKFYIIALQRTNQYTEPLYEALVQLLRALDAYGGQIFENRRELMQEKQKWTLQYVYDLAKGEEYEKAMAQLSLACKGELFFPNDMVDAAWEVGEGLIHSGEFEAARQFLDQYFSPKQQQVLVAMCDEEHQQLLAQIADLLCLDTQVKNDFEADVDPQCHISYYHEYSRKNNSLLDRKYCAVADLAMEFDFSELTDEEITQHAKRLRSRSARENLLRLAPEAFALASEAGFRVLGYRHHYVQYMGAAAMADGKIAEILNGEGKTYTIVATAFLQWVFGKQVFVVDESPYLTQRNHSWMCGVYRLLGMESCHIKRYDEVKTTRADVYYIPLREMMFAYLSHETNTESVRSGLKLDVAIIDEIDTVLVDEAKLRYDLTRTEKDPETLALHEKVWQLAETLEAFGEEFTVRGKRVFLAPSIYPKLERAFGISWNDLNQLPRIQKIESVVCAAIACRFVYEENKDYFIHKGVPMQEDETRGVFTPFSTAYEYFLCRQNGLDCSRSQQALLYRNCILNAICVRDLFRKFRTVCGTTATAVSFRKEFKEIYDLEYVAIPPHSPVIRQDTQSPLYVSARHKDRAILEMIAEKQQRGQPVLLITQSIAESEKYHKLLRRVGIPHRLLNAKNADEAADILSTAGMPGSVLVANALVSRGADIRLGGNPERQTLRTLVEMGVDISGLEDFLYRLPTPEQKESALYKKYYSILEQNRLLAARQRKEVVEAGGLCVIGASFFPEPRTEQQTRGRCGRQGEVGESRIFRSVDDSGLKSLLSGSYVEMALASMPDQETLDSPILFSALKRAQKSLHDSCFAHIRKTNSTSECIEKYRGAFVGLRMDLTEGLTSIGDLIEDWAADKGIHKQLQALQQGQLRCENAALGLLWQKDEALRYAKGLRTQRVLSDAFRKEFDRVYSAQPEEKREEIAVLLLCTRLKKAWEAYIGAALDAAQALKSPALDKFLAQEKDRLLQEALGSLLQKP